MVQRDLAEGWISSEAADSVYGVVIVDGEVDESATSARRAELADSATTSAYEFSFGPERVALDAAWPPAVARACAVLTSSAPVAVRQQVRRELYTTLAGRGDGTPDLDDLERVWTDVKSRLVAPAGER